LKLQEMTYLFGTVYLEPLPYTQKGYVQGTHEDLANEDDQESIGQHLVLLGVLFASALS